MPGCPVCSYNTCATGNFYATIFDTFNKTACQMNLWQATASGAGTSSATTDAASSASIARLVPTAVAADAAPQLKKHKLRPELLQRMLHFQLQQPMFYHPQQLQQQTLPVINCMLLTQLSSMHVKSKPCVCQAETALVESLGCQAGPWYTSTSNT